MKDFDWTSFRKRIAIKASISEIYQAWTTAEALETWFLKEVRFRNSNGHSIPHAEFMTPGSFYEWTWHLYPDTLTGRIIQANGTDFLQFTFEGECLVDVTLTEEHGYTIVYLQQHQIPTDDSSKKNIRLGCASGWAFYLVNLKSVYEGGIDLRNKDTGLPPMINN